MSDLNKKKLQIMGGPRILEITQGIKQGHILGGRKRGEYFKKGFQPLHIICKHCLVTFLWDGGKGCRITGIGRQRSKGCWQLFIARANLRIVPSLTCLLPRCYGAGAGAGCCNDAILGASQKVLSPQQCKVIL
jgi:hypothetical protein